MKEFKPPIYPVKYSKSQPYLFLAGSIDQGKAIDWQKQVVAIMSNINVNIFNPRRDNWDSTWKQDISNPDFAKQVYWELDMIEMCDHIFFYFESDQKSPITLLELGLVANKSAGKKIIVFCPEGYWRRGNVQVVCEKYGLELYDDFDNAIADLKIALQE